MIAAATPGALQRDLSYTISQFTQDFVFATGEDLSAVVGFVWPRLGLFSVTTDMMNSICKGKVLVSCDLHKLALFLSLVGCSPSIISERFEEMSNFRIHVNDGAFLGPDEFLLCLDAPDLDFYLYPHEGQYIKKTTEEQLARSLREAIRRASER